LEIFSKNGHLAMHAGVRGLKRLAWVG